MESSDTAALERMQVDHFEAEESGLHGDAEVHGPQIERLLDLLDASDRDLRFCGISSDVDLDPTTHYWTNDPLVVAACEARGLYVYPGLA